jgi:hypothetical protein
MQNDHWNRGNTSRRELLKDLGALGAGSALAATGLLAQSGRKRGRIDVHHHRSLWRLWRSLAPKPLSSR